MSKKKPKLVATPAMYAAAVIAIDNPPQGALSIKSDSSGWAKRIVDAALKVAP